MTQLAPCPDCKRHARVADPVCPFCGSPALRTPVPLPRRIGRLTRAAVYFAGAMSLASCSGEDDNGGGADIYGGPPVEEPEPVAVDPAPEPIQVQPDPPPEPIQVQPDPPPPPEPQPEPVVQQPVEQPAPVPAYGGPPPEIEDPSSQMAMYGGPAVFDVFV